MSLRCSGQGGLHEVYTASHDESVTHLAAYDILRIYASDWRFIIEAMYFKGTFSVKSWAYYSASSVIEAATFSCF